ncbi:MAG: hypothetical protein ABIG61_01710 [Planctomycetota bacterium]
MQLNLSDNSNRFVRAFRGLIDFITPVVKVLGYALVGSIIVCGLFLFGKIVWIFFEMLLKAVGRF